MERSREELGRIHKEKCKELKQIRARMAEDLGVELHQTECTYEGYCSGTCPKCKQEEWKLNAALMKRQMPVIPGYSAEEEVKHSAQLLKNMGILEENIVSFTYLT